VVVPTCNLSIQEAKARGLQVPGQPGIRNETLSYQKKKKRKRKYDVILRAFKRGNSRSLGIRS
jgi:hypothetical protein